MEIALQRTLVPHIGQGRCYHRRGTIPDLRPRFASKICWFANADKLWRFTPAGKSASPATGSNARPSFQVTDLNGARNWSEPAHRGRTSESLRQGLGRTPRPACCRSDYYDNSQRALIQHETIESTITSIQTQFGLILPLSGSSDSHGKPLVTTEPCDCGITPLGAFSCRNTVG